MGHVLARAAGFGLAVVPIWPYRLERLLDEHDSILVSHGDGGSRRSAVVRPSAGGPLVELRGAASLDEVADVVQGPSEPGWRIETSLWSIDWPERFAVEPPPDQGAFDLHGPGRSLVYVQGPLTAAGVPPAERMAGPGQEVIGRCLAPGGELIEVGYMHEERCWRMLHRVTAFGEARRLVVTGQCPVEMVDEVRDTVELVARSVRPR